MKTLLSAILLLFATAISAQDYFWVGDGGNWSDLTHWATTSGGSTFHSQVPGPNNDVYFDANSFTMTNQIVTMDQEVSECRTLNCTGVTNNPKLKGNGFYDDILVYGDFIVPSEMERDFKGVEMHGSGTVTIVTGEKHLGGSCFFQMAGDGDYNLMDSLSTANLYVYGGRFYSNDNPIYTSQRLYCQSPAGQELHLGTSNFYTQLWDVTTSNNTVIDVDEATIFYGSSTNIFHTFNGAGADYHKVVFYGSCNISGYNSFDEFIAAPGSSINLTAGTTQTAQQFEFQGNAELPVVLASLTAGEQAYLVQTSGSVNGTYMTLSDSNASGGATFNADDSIDLGNNTGWNIQISVPEDYYWVGGSGSWSELNHWATTSGGTTYHTTPPTAIDDVFIDGNSFPGGTGTLEMDSELMNVHDLMMSGIPSEVIINQLYSSSLNIYGSFEADDDCVYHMVDVYFLSLGTETIDGKNNSLGNNAEFTFDGGGTYNLISGLNLRTLMFNDGFFNTDGNDVTATFQIAAPGTYGDVADFSDSYVTVRLWSPGNGANFFTVDNTTIHCTGNFTATWMDYYNVIMDADQASTVTDFYAEYFTVTPGTELFIDAGTTITTDNLSIVGTPDQPISILSDTEGTEAFFSQSAGTVDAWYVTLQDNHATGGATFNASMSIELDNVEGWNILEPEPMNFYWVGDAGNWSDLTHWATTSGGAVNPIALPSSIDHVIFDANSFSGTDFTVNIDQLNAVCGSLSMENLPMGTALIQASNSTITIHGDFTADAAVYLNLANVRFTTPDAATINTAGVSFGPNSSITFAGEGSHEAGGNIACLELIFEQGPFDAAGFSIDVEEELSIDTDQVGDILLNNTTVSVGTWNPGVAAANLDVAGTTFNCDGIFYSEGLEYATLNLDGICSIWGSCSMGELSVAAGSTIQLEAGETIVVDNLDLTGTDTEHIIVRSSQQGSEAFFSKTSGEVNGWFLELEDNHATGGAVFTAYNSTFVNNVEGWNLDTHVSDNHSRELAVYPNPAVESCTIFATRAGQVRIFTAQGQMIDQLRIAQGQNNLDLSSWNAGTYILVFSNQHEVRTQNLVVH